MRNLHKHLHNFFIPHEGNNHLPHAVRHKSLHAYAGVLIGLKVLLVALLFVSFPSIAEFSVITQARIAQLVNESRVANGLGPVKISPTLQHAAELKLQDMINEHYFAHTSPDGEVPWKWFKQAGYLYTYAGENLAMNFSDAEDAHEAWMNSPTHRSNIMNGNYQEIGVAVGVGEIDGEQATLVVQLFGTSFVPPTIVEEPSAPIPRIQGEEIAIAPETTPQPEAGEPSAQEPVVVPEPEPFVEPIVEQVTEPEVALRLPDAVQPPVPAAQPETAEPIVETPETQPIIEPVEAPLPTERVVVPIDTSAASQKVLLETPEKSDAIGYILRFIQKFYWILLGFIAFALMLKIFIRIRVQHKKIIAHGALVIAIGFLLLAIHLHFLESISGPVLIF